MNRAAIYKVGMASFLMLVIISGMLIWKSGIFLRAAGYQVIGEFQNVNGLLKGAEVRYRGYRVGRVSSIVPGPVSIRAYFSVKSDTEIPEGSKLRVVFDGLIGEKYLDIVPNSASNVMIRSNEVLAGYATSGLADFVDVGTQNLNETKAILESMRGILTSPDVAEAIRNTFLRFEKITNDLSKIVALAGDERIKEMTLNFSQVSQDLMAMSKNLKEMSDELRAQGLSDKFGAILSNLEAVSVQVKGSESQPGLLSQMTSMGATLATVRAAPEASLRYSFQTKAAFADANVDLRYHNSFFRVGASDRFGDVQFMNFQHGTRLSDQMTARFGVFYNKVGLGVDYKVDKFKLSADFFNPQQMEVDLMGKFALDRNIDLAVGLAKDRASSAYSNYSLGVNFHP